MSDPLPTYRCSLGHEGTSIGITTTDAEGRITNHCSTCYIAWIRATIPEVTKTQEAQ